MLSLREAVDSGSPALAEALLDDRIRGRYPVSELSEMRDLARRWHEAGVEAELRRRTGSQDALVRTRVEDDEYYSVDEFTLGRMTVRDGHGAILTHLTVRGSGTPPWSAAARRPRRGALPRRRVALRVAPRRPLMPPPRLVRLSLSSRECRTG